MIPRLSRDPEAPAPRSTDLVDGWLRVFIGLLKLPVKEAAAIREELEGHLRERVRDLMLSGMAEGEATKQAIGELGEAADVAARYRAVRAEPRRRLVMHAMLFGVAGAALALSVAAFRGGQQPEQKGEDAKQQALRQALTVMLAERQNSPVPVIGDMPLIDELMSRAAVAAEPLPLPVREEVLRRILASSQAQAKGGTAYVPQALPPELEGVRTDWEMKETGASDALEFVGKLSGLPVHARWNLLNESQLQTDTGITFRAKQAGVGGFLRAVNEAAGVSGGKTIDVRVTDGVLEVAPREYFDRREMALVSYDLSGIIAARIGTYNEKREEIVENVIKAITQFVDPEQWVDNGGNLAKQSVVGDRLFVEAPRRFHPQIRWILDQLPKGGEHSQAAPAGATVVQRYYVKYTNAEEVRQAISKVDSVKAIDFGQVVTDQSTNSIICRATPELQILFKVALESIDRPVGARSAAPEQTGCIYVSGQVARAGVYAVPPDGISVRRLLVAAGGTGEAATMVVVSDSKDGASKVVQEIPIAALGKEGGPDPILKQGQLVSVK